MRRRLHPLGMKRRVARQRMLVSHVSATPPPVVAASAPTVLSGRRRALIWTLVLLAALIGLITILTMWVNRQMLDNKAWQKASTQVIADKQVQSALSVYLVD